MKSGEGNFGYELLRIIGRGAFAEVWVARSLTLPKRVASKVLHPHKRRDGRVERALFDEASSVFRLRHPNIVLIENYDAERCAIVMDLVDGPEFGRPLDLAPFGLPVVPGVGKQVCRMLEEAHVWGMLHLEVLPNCYGQQERPR